MNKFDKMIRGLSRNVDIPKGFTEKMDTLLESLPDDEEDKGQSIHIIP